MVYLGNSETFGKEAPQGLEKEFGKKRRKVGWYSVIRSLNSASSMKTLKLFSFPQHMEFILTIK